ncbi:uncharacterized protein [Anolis sagrei]|uniref:uncharacterized protein isoform X2 n=1 Tax=Anolis sagrei TaxID=38937 RepID=UPI003521ACAE
MAPLLLLLLVVLGLPPVLGVTGSAVSPSGQGSLPLPSFSFQSPLTSPTSRVRSPVLLGDPALCTWLSAAMLRDLKCTPGSREPGWYLSLMAPNVKGPKYAWLDPSRLYCHHQAFHDCVEDLIQPFRGEAIDLVAGIDAMGFILGAAIASTLQKGFLAIRKVGHLCVETLQQPYRDYSGRDKLMEASKSYWWTSGSRRAAPCRPLPNWWSGREAKWQALLPSALKTAREASG